MGQRRASGGFVLDQAPLPYSAIAAVKPLPYSAIGVLGDALFLVDLEFSDLC